MRKTMLSATITWLSSCMRERAARISLSENAGSWSLLTACRSVVIPTDWACASWKTENSLALKDFSLEEEEEEEEEEDSQFSFKLLSTNMFSGT